MATISADPPAQEDHGLHAGRVARKVGRTTIASAGVWGTLAVRVAWPGASRLRQETGEKETGTPSWQSRRPLGTTKKKSKLQTRQKDFSCSIRPRVGTAKLQKCSRSLSQTSKARQSQKSNRLQRPSRQRRASWSKQLGGRSKPPLALRTSSKKSRGLWEIRERNQ